ncbi:Flp family type IVb pilin [Piscinibacter sp.]|uniref:Flp family type IVb pilin n=1 Tax=Piscinibacter sp. TaxID=1903157 RepID=UPI002C3336D6|nr:Flp family type IVb pilin [Albitalea sp.]HUG24663.1 Flp family type IVb pilin [Albitalea sp.]
MSIECPGFVGWTAELLRDEEGVTAIEYGLLAALIAIACIVAFQATGTSVGAIFDYWSEAVIAAL